MGGFTLFEFLIALVLVTFLLFLSEMVLSRAALEIVFDQQLRTAEQYLENSYLSGCKDNEILATALRKQLPHVETQCQKKQNHVDVSVEWRSSQNFWKCNSHEKKAHACLSLA